MDTRDRSAALMHGAHSADVKLFLHIHNRTIRLAQVCEHSIKPAEAVGIEAGCGDLEIQIDGRSHRRKVTVLATSSQAGWIDLAR